MTKTRLPLTPERALTRIADLIVIDAMAQLSGRATRTVLDWSDPGTSAGISLADAIAFDLAYQDAGGDHCPIFEAYGAQIELARASERFGSLVELSRRTEAALKEGSEACCALIVATRPGATAADRAAALREVEEAQAALARTLPLLAESVGDGQPP